VSARAVLAQQPVAIAAALRAVLYVGVLLGWLQLDAEQLAGIAIAAELVLGLFSWASVTPNVKATAQAAAAYQAGYDSAQNPPAVPVGA
jgi:hypothetical protein